MTDVSTGLKKVIITLQHCWLKFIHKNKYVHFLILATLSCLYIITIILIKCLCTKGTFLHTKYIQMA